MKGPFLCRALQIYGLTAFVFYVSKRQIPVRELIFSPASTRPIHYISYNFNIIKSIKWLFSQNVLFFKYDRILIFNTIINFPYVKVKKITSHSYGVRGL